MIPNQLPPFNFGLGETADMLRDTVAGFAAEKTPWRRSAAPRPPWA
jgi:hypothetical protein